VKAHEVLERTRGGGGDADVVEELVETLIDDAELRGALAMALLRDFGPVDRRLIIALAEIETHRAREEGGCGDPLYALCFMLFWLGNEDDYDVIVTAKESNQDAGTMIDSYMLTMRKAECPERIDREKHPHVYLAVLDAMRERQWEDDDDFRDGVLAYFGLTSGETPGDPL
jgi:hypothetical protein